MNEINKRELDDYIMGVNIHEEEEVLHKCPHCQSVKSIPMFYELGGWFYCDDDDPFCDYCKVDDGEGMKEMTPEEERDFQFAKENGKYSDQILNGYWVIKES
jgi:hypothetical protein